MRWIPAILLISPWLGACANPQPPSTPSTAAEALGQHSCKIVPNRLNPLAVDWPQHDRVDLEAMLRDRRVVVVAYDCASLRVLPDCRLPGEYGYIGVTPKETVERLVGESEIAVNLPLNGLGVAAKLGADSSESASLVVAMATVGLRRTTRAAANRTELVGTCEGATHFVRGVKVGAFAIRRGESREHGTAASIFGVGADARSSSERESSVSEGSLESCRSADISAEHPPNACGAPLQLELVALEARSDGGVTCANGLVWTGEKCAADESVPHQCESGNATDCKAECDRGHRGSCHELGKMTLEGRNAEKNPEAAFSLFEKNCELGWTPSCNNVGVAYASGVGADKNILRAVGYYERACDEGFEIGCVNLGAMYLEGEDVPKNASLGARLLHRACEAGESHGCLNMGIAYSKGMGVPADPARSFNFFLRACEGGNGLGCIGASRALIEGDGVAKDLPRALRLLESECAKKDGATCTELGSLYWQGKSVPTDMTRAAEYMRKACDAGDEWGCQAKSFLDVLAQGDTTSARVSVLFQSRCDQGDMLACFLLAENLRKGAGVDKDEVKARALYEKACAGGHEQACPWAGNSENNKGRE